jgi:GntR family transcriptional regulator
MDPRTSPTPLFAQVRDDIRARILAGSLAPGDKLPAEGALERQFGVSRITIRQALAELHAGGLIEKVNGRGSFVKRPAPPSDLGPLTGFYEVMRRRGHTAIGEVSAVKTLPAPAPVAAALRIVAGAPVAMVMIVRIVDGEPHVCQTCYGSVGLVSRLVAEDLATNDLTTILHQRMGYRLTRSQIEFEAGGAGALMARRLKIGKGHPVLRVRITTYDGHDTPVMYNEFEARGDRFRYQLDMRY